MDNSTQHLIRKSLRLLLAAAVAAVLLLFFAVPILFLLCGGVAAAIGGLAIIGLFTILQLPLFLLLMRSGLLPQPQCNDQEVDNPVELNAPGLLPQPQCNDQEPVVF